MAYDPKKIQKFKQLLEIATESLTREEFVATFKASFAEIGRVLKDRHDEDIRNALSTLEEARKEIQEAADSLGVSLSTESQKRLTKIEERVNSFIERFNSLAEKTLTEQAEGMKFIYDKVSKMKSGEPGKDGDPGKDADEDKIVSKIEKDLWEQWEKELKRLKDEFAAIPKVTGGGITNMRIAQAFKYILKTETPTGAVDGANLTYTVSQNIFAILSLSINGETIAQLPNYTISGKSFTFSTALPSDYSGKDFEVKYV